MTDAGLAAFNNRVSYDAVVLEIIATKEVPLPPEIENSLRANKRVWNNFNNLAPGYRKQYIGWLGSAKKPDTRKKRLREAVKLLEKNEKLGMK